MVASHSTHTKETLRELFNGSIQPMPQIPAASENGYLWHCPLCHEPSIANDYDGHVLTLRCANGHEWTWDGTWLQWDVPDENGG